MPQLFPAIGSFLTAGAATGTTATVIGGAAVGAGVGAGTAALTGGDPWKGAAFGALTGGIGAGVGSIGAPISGLSTGATILSSAASGAAGGVKTPKAATPVKPQAPVSAAAPEVFQAKRQQQKSLKLRRGIGSTIIAGGTPGLGSTKQLLGGGG